MSNIKAVTVRFPVDVIEAAHAANDGGDSFNSFVVNSVRDKLKEKEFRTLYDSFTKIAESEESDSEFAFDSQAEVVLGGD